MAAISTFLPSSIECLTYRGDHLRLLESALEKEWDEKCNRRQTMSRSQLKVKPVAEFIMRPFSFGREQVEAHR